MKLKKFLKHIDGVSFDVILWVGDNGQNETDIPNYMGNIWEVPESLLNLKMVKVNENHFEGIRLHQEKNEHGATLNYMIIALK